MPLHRSSSHCEFNATHKATGATYSVGSLAKKALRESWEQHPDAEEPLVAWYREAEKEDGDAPVNVKAKYRTASIVAGNRVVFNIKGNDFRLVVKVNCPYRVVYIRFVGTHAEYDEIDAEEV